MNKNLILKCSIVITTYNRYEHLERCLRYHLSALWPVNILILDSSQHFEENLKVPKTNLIRHLKFQSEISVAKKIASGLAEVETQYCCLLADDDILDPKGLEKNLEQLEQDKSIIACHGTYFRFWKNPSKKEFFINPEYFGKSIEDDSPQDRVLRILNNYESPYYAVYRTENLKKIFDWSLRNEDLLFQELSQAILATIDGKIRRIRDLYYLRQSCEIAEEGRRNWQTWYWFIENPREIFIKYQIYLSKIKEFLQESGYQKNFLNPEYFLDIAHAVYFSKCVLTDYLCKNIKYYSGNNCEEIFMQSQSIFEKHKSRKIAQSLFFKWYEKIKNRILRKRKYVFNYGISKKMIRKNRIIKKRIEKCLFEYYD